MEILDSPMLPSPAKEDFITIHLREKQLRIADFKERELTRRDTILRKMPRLPIKQESFDGMDYQKHADVSDRVFHNCKVVDASVRQASRKAVNSSRQNNATIKTIGSLGMDFMQRCDSITQEAERRSQMLNQRARQLKESAKSPTLGRKRTIKRIESRYAMGQNMQAKLKPQKTIKDYIVVSHDSSPESRSPSRRLFRRRDSVSVSQLMPPAMSEIAGRRKQFISKGAFSQVALTTKNESVSHKMMMPSSELLQPVPCEQEFTTKSTQASDSKPSSARSRLHHPSATQTLDEESHQLSEMSRNNLLGDGDQAKQHSMMIFRTIGRAQSSSASKCPYHQRVCSQHLTVSEVDDDTSAKLNSSRIHRGVPFKTIFKRQGVYDCKLQAAPSMLYGSMEDVTQLVDEEFTVGHGRKFSSIYEQNTSVSRLSQSIKCQQSQSTVRSKSKHGSKKKSNSAFFVRRIASQRHHSRNNK